MTLVIIGKGNPSDYHIWAEYEMETVPRKGDAITYHGEDGSRTEHLVEYVSFDFTVDHKILGATVLV